MAEGPRIERNSKTTNRRSLHGGEWRLGLSLVRGAVCANRHPLRAAIRSTVGRCSHLSGMQNCNKTNERNSMNNKFDELTKSMSQSVTRRGALRKFGVGLASMALACFGLANSAKAGNPNSHWCQGCIKNCKSSGLSQEYCQQACKGQGFC